jgi:hypothetical protein
MPNQPAIDEQVLQRFELALLNADAGLEEVLGVFAAADRAPQHPDVQELAGAARRALNAAGTTGGDVGKNGTRRPSSNRFGWDDPSQVKVVKGRHAAGGGQVADRAPGGPAGWPLKRDRHVRALLGESRAST